MDDRRLWCCRMPKLLPGLVGLRSQELCAWLDLGLEHDAEGALVPVDLETGEVIGSSPRWLAWLGENYARQLRAITARARRPDGQRAARPHRVPGQLALQMGGERVG